MRSVAHEKGVNTFSFGLVLQPGNRPACRSKRRGDFVKSLSARLRSGWVAEVSEAGLAAEFLAFVFLNVGNGPGWQSKNGFGVRGVAATARGRAVERGQGGGRGDRGWSWFSDRPCADGLCTDGPGAGFQCADNPGAGTGSGDRERGPGAGTGSGADRLSESQTTRKKGVDMAGRCDKVTTSTPATHERQHHEK